MENTLKCLENKKALVSGGTRGIGFAIANKLDLLGANVTVTGRTPSPTHKLPAHWNYIAVDFLNSFETEQFAKRVQKESFDILVNNAGINKIAPILEVDCKDFDRILQVNLRAPFLLTQAVLRGMIERGWGRIINISSIFGVVSKSARASYSSSKFGLEGLTKAVAAEVAASGVLVNSLSPGFIDTDLTQEVLGPSGIADIAKQIPMKRLGNPDEIAEFVGWLASPQNTYVSGQNLIIDGGFTSV